MASGKGVPAGPTPEDFSSKLWAASAGANCSTSDNLPKGATAYGQVLTQPLLSYTAGTDVASVTFAGSDPINNAQVQGSYFEVQMSADASDSSWSAVAVDSDWETRYVFGVACSACSGCNIERPKQISNGHRLHLRLHVRVRVRVYLHLQDSGSHHLFYSILLFSPTYN